MDVLKLNKNTIDEFFQRIEKGDKTAFGVYLYKGLKILIRKKDPLTPSEKYKRFYLKRRAAGLCVQCGEKIKEKNPKTGKTYRYCAFHRDEESKRKKEKRDEEKGVKEEVVLKNLEQEVTNFKKAKAAKNFPAMISRKVTGMVAMIS